MAKFEFKLNADAKVDTYEAGSFVLDKEKGTLVFMDDNGKQMASFLGVTQDAYAKKVLK